jgi:four helix bundle protein
MQRNSKARRRWVLAGLAGLALLSTATVVGLRFPQPFLAVNDCGRGTERGGDCIVILGGENWTRVPRAIALYRSNAAPHLLITGTGDAQDNLRMLLKAGVPESVILLETKQWPNDERFALIDQLRRSSRSIGANIAESWAKRRYPAHFVSKLTDADGELQETMHWIDRAAAYGYLAPTKHTDLEVLCAEIGRKLGKMMQKPDAFR